MKTVATGEVTIRYSINEYEMSDRVVYSWVTSQGEHSDEWFETADAAERDLRSAY